MKPNRMASEDSTRKETSKTPPRGMAVVYVSPPIRLDFGGRGRVVRGPMIKADLVTAMAKASGGSKVSAEKALNALLGNVFDSLRRGRKVTIGGFGTFLVSRRAERNGRNPRTGKAIKIPACRVPRFKPSRSLKHHLQ